MGASSLPKFTNLFIPILFVCLCLGTTLTVHSQGRRSEYIYHVVERGQNLYRIAMKYGTSVQELQRWNRLHGNTIRVGQKLIVGRSLGYKQDQRDPFGDGEPWEAGSVSKQNAVPPKPNDPTGFPRPAYGNDRKNPATRTPPTLEGYQSWEAERPQAQSRPGSYSNSTLYSFFLGKPIRGGERTYNYGAGSDQMVMLGHLLTQQEGKAYEKVELFSFNEGPGAYTAFNNRINQLQRSTSPSDVVFVNLYAVSNRQGGRTEIIPSPVGKTTRSHSPSFKQVLSLTDRIPGKKLILCDVDVSRDEAEDYLATCNIRGDQVAIFISSWKNPGQSASQWHHGAIFRAFTLALEGAADFNRDGQITLMEADIYLNDKVSEITGSIQFAHMIYHNYSNPNEVVLAKLY